MESIDSLLLSLERSGGYAVLVGITLIGVFWLARQQLSEQAKRSVAREERELARHQMELERALEYVSRESLNAAEHRADKKMMFEYIKSNTEAVTKMANTAQIVLELQRQTKDAVLQSHMAPKGGE